MKILYITNSMDPKSGIGRYSSAVVNGVKKKGFECKVVSNYGGDYKIGGKESSINSIFLFVKNIIKIRNISKDYDVVHALDGWPFGVYGYFSTIWTHKKLILSGIGTYSMVPEKISIKKVLMKLMYKKATVVLCISHYVMRRILKSVPDAKTKVVFMGTTLLPKLSESEFSKYKIKFNLINDKYPIILTVGGIKDRKGQFDTVKAVKILKEKYSKILYVMIGFGNDSRYAERIKSFISENELTDNVLILDNINTDKELSFLYNACDVFALNSNTTDNHFEGFGLVLLEAAQFGKPSVGSSCSGIEDAIYDGNTGYLTNQRDEKDISEKIDKILTGHDLSESVKKFAKKFTWKSTLNQYSEYYNI